MGCPWDTRTAKALVPCTRDSWRRHMSRCNLNHTGSTESAGHRRCKAHMDHRNFHKVKWKSYPGNSRNLLTRHIPASKSSRPGNIVQNQDRKSRRTFARRIRRNRATDLGSSNRAGSSASNPGRNNRRTPCTAVPAGRNRHRMRHTSTPDRSSDTRGSSRSNLPRRYR